MGWKLMLLNMGLIKAQHVPLSASPFSMADIEDAAKRVLLRARQQAEQLLAAAQEEGEKIKAAAKVEGMAEGIREGTAQGMEQGKKAGQQQALAEHKAELQKSVAALTDAATTLNTTRLDLHSMALQEVVKLAIAIARRVTKRQGIFDTHVLTANLEEAMKLVVTHTNLRISIHPSQRKALDEALPQLSLKWPSLKHVEIAEEETISPGGSRITTCQGQINADLDVQLDRVVADLLPVGN
jgi:flagellar assembly protein FliH